MNLKEGLEIALLSSNLRFLKVLSSLPKGSRIYQPEMCRFGILIILKRHTAGTRPP